jgi:hypothetical protein
MSNAFVQRRIFRLTALIQALSLILCATGANGQDVAVKTRPFDLQKFVDNAIASGQKRIVIPPGRYRVTPVDRHHLLLQNLSDIDIIADGVEMVCTQTTRALTISHCTNLRLTGMTIDYDPLPYTEGVIVSMSADKNVHEIRLFDGYPGPDQVLPDKYEIFRPDTRTLRSHDYNYTVEKMGPRSIRVIKKNGSPSDPEQVGDLIAINAQYAPDGSDPHAIMTESSTAVRLEHVTLYASNCFGFFEMDCDGTTYDHCRIDRRDPADDSVKREQPRVRSLDADAYHSKFASKGPSLLNCSARFQGDDGLNICGAYHLVTASHGHELRVLANGNGKFFAAGEPLELFTYDGRRLPDAKAVAVEPDGKITAAEQEFVSHQKIVGANRGPWHSDAFRVTLDRDVEMQMGSLVCSTQRVGNGFLVKGCDFSFNRSRGILIKASDGQVIGNTCTGNWGPAILVSPEYYWLEAGSSNNVQISDNTIRDCRTTAIRVTAAGGNGEIAPAGAHNNIVISNNSISACPLPNIVVTSTDHLSMFGNAISQPLIPSDSRQTPEEIQTENCTNVSTEAPPATTQPVVR